MTNKKNIIELKVKTEKGHTFENHEIEKLKFKQFNRTFAVVADILQAIEDNEGVKDLVFDMFFGGSDGFDEEDLEGLTDEEVEAVKTKADDETHRKFVKGIFNSFNILLVHLPEQCTELISVVSGIERDVLDEQDFELGFDVFEVIMSVNDVEQLIKRAKESFGLGKRAVAFLKKEKTAESNTKKKAIPLA